MSVIIYKADGGAFDHSDEFTHEPPLKWLQDAVGGWIEAVYLGDAVMYVNEEGKLLKLPVNTMATDLYADHHGPYDIIVGDVVVLDGEHTMEEEA